MTKLIFKKGQMLIIGILFLALLLIFSTTIFTKVRYFINFGTNATLREQARHVAEAGVDYAAREITANSNYEGTVLPGPLFIDVGTTGNFEVDVQQDSDNLKTVTVTGYVPKFLGFKAKTKIQIQTKPSGAGNVATMGAIRDSAIVENNNYIYSIGGTQGGCSLGIPFEALSDVQFAKIINDGSSNDGYLETSGTPPTIGYTSRLPETRRAPGAVAANGYIYVIAGNGDGCNEDRSTVFFAKPEPNGEILSWSTSTQNTPVAGPVQYAFVHNGYIYIVQDSTISYTELDPDGDPNTPELGIWNPPLPTPDDRPSYVYEDGYIYHISGYYTRSVWYAKIDDADHSVGPFIEIPDVLPTRTTFSAVTVADEFIYVMGGRKLVENPDSVGPEPPAKTVYYQKINPGPNPTIDPFLTSPKNLPNPRWADYIFGSISRNDKIFLFGGLEDPGNGSSGGNIWVADIIGPDGEIDNWTDNGGTVTYTGWALDKATYKYK